MKIEFENDKEKEVLKHILSEWFIYNDDLDVLGCEPACRDESSPGCDWCIKNYIHKNLEKNKLRFHWLGGEDWILEKTIKLYIKEGQK